MYKINEKSERHEDAPISVKVLMEEAASQADNPYVFYKDPGVEVSKPQRLIVPAFINLYASFTTELNNLSHQHHMPTIFTSICDLTSSTLYLKGSNKYHKLACINTNRECRKCGVAKMTSKIQPLLDMHEGTIKWKRWERECKSSKGDQTKTKGKKNYAEGKERTVGETCKGVAERGKKHYHCTCLRHLGKGISSAKFHQVHQKAVLF